MDAFLFNWGKIIKNIKKKKICKKYKKNTKK